MDILNINFNDDWQGQLCLNRLGKCWFVRDDGNPVSKTPATDYLGTWNLHTLSLCCVVLSRSVMSDSVIPWIAVHQAPLSMGVLRVRILEWVAIPSCRGSSQLRDQIQVSHIAGRFFTNWATREGIVLGATIRTDTKIWTIDKRKQKVQGGKA